MLVVSEETRDRSLARARARCSAGSRRTQVRPARRCVGRRPAMSRSRRRGRPTGAAARAWRCAVLLGYVLTLAPTRHLLGCRRVHRRRAVLGIPHPPGTPLFVMIAHVWGMLVPVGEFAARTNLLSALFSAAGAGCFFLVVHESLRDMEPPPAARRGAGGRARCSARFTFTNWQNSNETEVYAVATFTIARDVVAGDAVAARAGARRAPRDCSSSIVYLAGLSIGNHLLALLAGPAVVAFLVVTLRSEPAAGSRGPASASGDRWRSWPASGRC